MAWNEQQVIEEMLSKKKWAVLGATPNQTKTANRIVRKLIDRGYQVYCVNPNYNEGDGMPYYKCIGDIPEKPEVVDVVVPPAVAMEAIEALDPKDVPCLWFQPGTYNSDVIALAKQKGFQVVGDGSCVMVELG